MVGHPLPRFEVPQLRFVVGREARAEQGTAERGRSAHPHRLAIEERTVSLGGGEDFLHAWVEDDADHRFAVQPEADRHAIRREIVDVVASPVERIDDPNRGVVRRPRTFDGMSEMILFADEGMVGVLAEEELLHRFLRRVIGFGHQIVAFLLGDVELRAPRFENRRSDLGGFDGRREVLGQRMRCDWFHKNYDTNLGTGIAVNRAVAMRRIGRYNYNSFSIRLQGQRR